MIDHGGAKTTLTDKELHKWTTVVYISFADHGGPKKEESMLEKADTGQFKVRLPLELKQWLQEQADNQRRSLTAEVVLRLESTRPKAPAAQKGKQ